MRWSALLFLLMHVACTSTPTASDPCEPNGHIHRSAQEGDWCHCVEGFIAQASEPGCEVDPNYKARGPMDLQGAISNACWHSENGPFEPLDVTTNVNVAQKFKTVYRVKLKANESGSFDGTFNVKPWTTGRFAVLSSSNGTLKLKEGALEIQPEKTEDISLCSGFSKASGYSLIQKVSYTLDVGAASTPEIQMMLEEVP